MNIKSYMIKLTKCYILPVLGSSLLSLPTHAGIILQDGFEYADTTAMSSAGWSYYAGVPSLTPTDSDTNNVLGLYNRRVGKDLSTTLTQDFSLTFNVDSSNRSRLQYALLTSTDGSGNMQGYALAWNISSSTSNSFAEIYRVDTDEATWTGNNGSPGTKLKSSNVESITTLDDPPNVPTAASELDTFSLTWDNSGLFTVFVNSNQVYTHTDTTYSSFNKVYLSGNTSGYFDDLSVSTVIPEPSAFALMGLGLGAALLLRKKQKLS